MAADLRAIRDDALVRRAQDGNRAAFGLLLDRHQAAIRALLDAWPADEEAAARLELAAARRAYRYLDRFDPIRSFRPWLMKMVVNLLFAQERRARVEPSKGRSSPATEPDGPFPSHPRLLPRAVLALNSAVGMRPEEIAESLAIPVPIVDDRLQSARETLARSGGPGMAGKARAKRATEDRQRHGVPLSERFAQLPGLDRLEEAWIRPAAAATGPSGPGRRRTRAVYGAIAFSAIVIVAILVILLGESPLRPGRGAREREMEDRYRAWRQSQTQPTASAPEPATVDPDSASADPDTVDPDAAAPHLPPDSER